MTDITQIARDETATEDISDLAGQEENAGLDIETSNLSIGSRPVARFLAAGGPQIPAVPLPSLFFPASAKWPLPFLLFPQSSPIITALG